MITQKLSSEPTNLQLQLQTLLRRMLADDRLLAHPFFSVWTAVQQNADHIAPDGIFDYCCTDCDPNDLLWIIADTVADLSKQNKAYNSEIADLVAHMCLVAFERWIGTESIAKICWKNGLPVVGMFDELAAAVVAATWFNLGIQIKINEEAEGKIEVSNLITDRPETQFLAKDVEAAIEEEIVARITHHLPIQKTHNYEPLHPKDICAGIRRFTKRTGAHLMIGFGTVQSHTQATKALRDRIKERWEIELFLYENHTTQTTDTTHQNWIKLQKSLTEKFSQIINPLHNTPYKTDNPPPNNRHKAFICYSRTDKSIFEHIVKHIGVLEHQKPFSIWHDQKIMAGANWKNEIDLELQQCNVAILLLSADFMGSKFILDHELPILLKRHEAEGMHLMPILIRPFAWSTVNWIKDLQIRPNHKEALSDKPRQRAIQLKQITEEIARLCGILQP